MMATRKRKEAAAPAVDAKALYKGSAVTDKVRIAMLYQGAAELEGLITGARQAIVANEGDPFENVVALTLLDRARDIVHVLEHVGTDATDRELPTLSKKLLFGDWPIGERKGQPS